MLIPLFTLPSWRVHHCSNFFNLLCYIYRSSRGQSFASESGSIELGLESKIGEECRTAVSHLLATQKSTFLENMAGTFDATSSLF